MHRLEPSPKTLGLQLTSSPTKQAACLPGACAPGCSCETECLSLRATGPTMIVLIPWLEAGVHTFFCEPLHEKPNIYIAILRQVIAV